MMAVQTAPRQPFSGVVVSINNGWAHVKNNDMRRVVSVHKPDLRLGDRLHATAELAQQPDMSPEAVGRYAIDPAERVLWTHFIASNVHVTDCRPMPPVDDILSAPAPASPSSRPRPSDLVAGAQFRNPRNRSVVKLVDRTTKNGRPAWRIEYTYITGSSRQHKALLDETIINGYERA